jgi:hypothetical protein
MNAFIYLCALSCACAAVAQPVQIVVPNHLANVEGNSSTSDPFTSSSFRLQMVFDASQFALPSGPGISNIVADIGFRIDESSLNSAGYFFPGGSVRLSTTQRTPDNLSSVFADNIGLDVTTIFSGSISFGNLYDPTSTPQPFNQSIPATVPFSYDPSRGNLLVDIVGRSGQVNFPGALDAQDTFVDSVSRVYAGSELQISGTADTSGLMTRFTFLTIPEPSLWVLGALALGILAVWRRRIS